MNSKNALRSDAGKVIDVGAAIRANFKIRRIPLGKMRVSPAAQRELKVYRVNKMLADFDLDKFGIPVLNERSPGVFYIIDGQHRVATVGRWLGDGWEFQKIDCRVYSGLLEKEEADMFDKLNDFLNVQAFDRFKIRVTAKRPIETDVKRIVEGLGLTVSRSNTPAGITCVGTLVRIYTCAGGYTLGRALRLIGDSFGDAGLQAKVIEGFSLVCQRYDGVIDEPAMTKKLGAMRGGINGLVNKAHLLRKSTGASLRNCLAGAIVDVANSGRGGKKLISWWKTD